LSVQRRSSRSRSSTSAYGPPATDFDRSRHTFGGDRAGEAQDVEQVASLARVVAAVQVKGPEQVLACTPRFWGSGPIVTQIPAKVGASDGDS
jgi:hypothetical protein